MIVIANVLVLLINITPNMAPGFSSELFCQDEGLQATNSPPDFSKLSSGAF